MPTKAVPPLPLVVGEPPENPLQLKTKIGGENFKNMKRVFWWGSCGFARTGGAARGYHLRFFAWRKLSCGVHCRCSLGLLVLK